jgi:hypothetical protein
VTDVCAGKAKVGLRAVACVSEHVFATGGGDAGISMWDVRMKKAVAVLQVMVVVAVVVVVMVVVVVGMMVTITVTSLVLLRLLTA